ncbi:MAG: carbohydrate binding domain-containing protein [Bacteroidetes bacterium]|nr:carbohydrate binding domain-containing protein [Bacteroidota bacterium]MCL1968952.1 carbohydrate binding domain-containing protein [Bacteroidota bacterium]
MKKITIIFVALLLIVGAVFAQQTKSLRNNSLLLQPVVTEMRSDGTFESTPRATTIFSHGFEGTTGGTANGAGALPSGWVSSPASGGTAGKTRWGTSGGAIVGVNGNVSPHSGTRFAYIAYNSTPHDAWMITSAFSLTAGTKYLIEFWVIMEGYDWYEELEVRIGTTQTVAGMTTSLWSSYTEDYLDWTKITVVFTPTTTGNHYLGFYSTSDDQIFTAVDDILVRTIDDNDLEVIPRFPYTQVPTSMPVTKFPAQVANIGLLPQTNVQLSVTRNNVVLGTASLPSIAPLTTVTLTPTGNILPTTGTNTLTYTVTQTEPDATPANNTADATFQGTPNIYAYDNVTTTSNGIGSNSNALSFGNIFEITASTTLSQVVIGFNSTATPGLPYTLSLYKMTGALTYNTTDLLSGFAVLRTPGWNTVAIPPTPLAAGERYILCINQLTAENVAVSYESIAGKILYVVQSGGSIYDGNVGYAAAIRMAFALPCNAAAPTNLTAVPAPNSVTLSWTGDAQTYRVTINNGTTNTIYYTSNTTLTITGLQTIPYTWSVAAICATTNNPSTAGSSFTPLSCTISTFPFSESFDGTTFPPACWTSTSTSSSPWQRVTTGGNPTCSTHSGAGMLQYNSYNYSSGNTGLLITPPIDRQNQILKLKFWMYRDAGQSSAADKVNVHISSTSTLSGATLLGTINRLTTLAPVVTAAGWYEYSFTLPVFSGERYIIFEGVSVYGNNIYVDDISLIALLNNDLEAVSITGNALPLALTPETYTVTVRNNGALTANSYIVKVMTEDNELLAQQTVTTTLATDATTTVPFQITFPRTMEGPLKIKGVVEYTGDQLLTNNTTSLLSLNVISFCSAKKTITGTISTPSGTATNENFPFGFSNNNSRAQSIYTAAELNMEPGTEITAISYNYVATTATAAPRSIRVRFAHTASSTLSGWIADSEFTTVYTGTVSVPATSPNVYELRIELSQPFVYTGGNLCIMTEKVYANNSNNSGVIAQRFPATGRTYSYANNTQIPTTIPNGTVYNYVPVTHFYTTKQFGLNPNNVLGTGAQIALNPTVITCDGNATATFSVANCYRITDVKIGGVSQGPVTSYEFTHVDATLPVITVETDLVHYNITATTGGNGIIDLLPGYITCQSSATCIIRPNFGYYTSELLVDDSPVIPPVNNLYTFLSGNTPHTIHAIFEPCPTFAIHYVIEGSGAVVYDNYPYNNPQGDIEICSGYNPEFDFVPSFGYEIEAVYVDGILNYLATSGHFMFINLHQNHQIRVVFRPIDYTIFASSGMYGSIEPAGYTIAPYGTTPHFDFIPFTGYEVDQVYIDNQPIGSMSSYDFVNISANHTIFVTFKRMALVIHLGWSDGGSLVPYGNTMVSTGTHSADVNVFYNDIQMISFAPEEGYKVSAVYVNGESYPNAISTGSYTFYYITQEQWLDVTFEKYTYPIKAQINDHGVISDEGITYVSHGEDKTYNFYALPGYEIIHVFVDGIDNGAAITSGTYTFLNIVASHTIDVITAPLIYKITATADEGSFITPSGQITVAYGEHQFFTFAPASGYEIDKVLVDDVPNGEAVQNGGYAFLNVQEDHTIKVISKLLRFNIKALAAPNGSIYPAGITELNYGEDITYTITPDENYKISFVLVNGDNMGSITTYTFAAVEADGTIEAFFAPSGGPVGINEPAIDGVNIYSHTNIVYIVNEKHLPISNLSIFDMYGRIVWQGIPQGNQIVLNVANGIYTVRVSANDTFTATKVNIQR